MVTSTAGIEFDGRLARGAVYGTYCRFIITTELQAMLERRIAVTGQSKSDVVRLALLRYLEAQHD